MTPKCLLCGKTTAAVSYHVFPKDVTVRGKWKEFCLSANIEEALLDHKSYLCSSHFLAEDYLHPIGSVRNNLNRHAVPSVYCSTNEKRIPTKEALRQQWIDAAPRANFQPSKTTDICGKNFTPDCFQFGKFGLNREIFVKPDATPTVFPIQQSSAKDQELWVDEERKIEYVEEMQCNTAGGNLCDDGNGTPLTRDVGTSPPPSSTEEPPVNIQPLDTCNNSRLVIEGSQHVVVKELLDEDPSNDVPLNEVTVTVVENNSSNPSSTCTYLKAVACSCTLRSPITKPTHKNIQAIPCSCTLGQEIKNSRNSEFIMGEDVCNIAVEGVGGVQMKHALLNEKPSPVLETDSAVSPCASQKQTVTNPFIPTTESNSGEKRRRWPRRWSPRYVGDFEVEDVDCQSRARRFWIVAKKETTMQRKKIRTLQQKNRRLTAHIDNLNILVKQLKEHIKNMQKRGKNDTLCEFASPVKNEAEEESEDENCEVHSE